MVYHAFQAIMFPYHLQRTFGSDTFDWFEIIAAEEDTQVDELPL